MVDRDRRDPAEILTGIEGEFRHALEAERDFLAWRSANPEAPFGEQLRRYVAWIEASEPYAASYRRVSAKFPEYMDDLHALLLPVQDEFLG